jgi:hypothetical protein
MQRGGMRCACVLTGAKYDSPSEESGYAYRMCCAVLCCAALCDAVILQGPGFSVQVANRVLSIKHLLTVPCLPLCCAVLCCCCAVLCDTAML